MKIGLSSSVRLNGQYKGKATSDLIISKEKLIQYYATAPYEEEVSCAPVENGLGQNHSVGLYRDNYVQLSLGIDLHGDKAADQVVCSLHSEWLFTAVEYDSGFDIGVENSDTGILQYVLSVYKCAGWVIAHNIHDDTGNLFKYLVSCGAGLYRAQDSDRGFKLHTKVDTYRIQDFDVRTALYEIANITV